MRKYLYVVAVVLIALSFAVSCSTTPKTGTLTVNLFQPIGAKMLLPPAESYTIVQYAVQLNAQFSPNPVYKKYVATDDPVTFEGLMPGEYTLYVYGFKTTEFEPPIALYIALVEDLPVNIIGYESKTVDAYLAWAAGPGTVDLQVSLLNNFPILVPEPSLTAQWYNGTSWADITFSKSGEVWDYLNESTPSGFAAVRWQMYGLMGGVNRLLAGVCEAVFIVQGQTTTGDYPVDANLLFKGEGEAIISIYEPPQPIIITFVSPPSTAKIGVPFTLTTFTTSPLDSYEWYRNGILIEGVSTSVLTYTETEVGYHYYSVLGKKTVGSILASAYKGINILP